MTPRRRRARLFGHCGEIEATAWSHKPRHLGSSPGPATNLSACRPTQHTRSAPQEGRSLARLGANTPSSDLSSAWRAGARKATARRPTFLQRCAQWRAAQQVQGPMVARSVWTRETPGSIPGCLTNQRRVGRAVRLPVRTRVTRNSDGGSNPSPSSGEVDPYGAGRGCSPRVQAQGVRFPHSPPTPALEAQVAAHRRRIPVESVRIRPRAPIHPRVG